MADSRRALRGIKELRPGELEFPCIMQAEVDPSKLSVEVHPIGDLPGKSGIDHVRQGKTKGTSTVEMSADSSSARGYGGIATEFTADSFGPSDGSISFIFASISHQATQIGDSHLDFRMD